jgi:hypothetical protein
MKTGPAERDPYIPVEKHPVDMTMADFGGPIGPLVESSPKYALCHNEEMGK